MTRRPQLSILRFSGLVLACAALILCFSLWTTAAQKQKDEDFNPQVDRGKKTFQQYCGFCHAPDATGARGPDLIRSALVAHDTNGDLIGQVIHQGRPEKGMPPTDLPNDQVTDIAAFLHFRIKESMASSGIPAGYSREKLLTGNLEAGKAFFNGAGGCKNCHSPTGDLEGVAKKYEPVDLQSIMLHPYGEHRKATITLPSGQQIKGNVKYVDDFVIGITDDSGWYRSFSRSQVKLEMTDPLKEHRELLLKITQKQMHDLFAYVESLK